MLFSPLGGQKSLLTHVLLSYMDYFIKLLPKSEYGFVR